MRSKKEPLYALLLVGFVWGALFSRWLPTPLQSVLLVIVLLLGMAMIVAGWWGWIMSRTAEGIPHWRKRVGLLGVVANTTALAVPLGSLLYMIYCPFLRVGVRLPMVNTQWMGLTVLGLSLSGLIAGIFAPPRSRFATALGGLIIGSIVLSIPMGIL